VEWQWSFLKLVNLILTQTKKNEERSKNFTKGGGIEAESSIMGCYQTNNGGEEAKVAKNWVIYG
jgi:hypothetical protein